MPGMTEGIAVAFTHGRLTPEKSALYRIATVEEVARWLETKRPALVIVGLASPKGFEEKVAATYRLAREVGGARLYVR